MKYRLLLGGMLPVVAALAWGGWYGWFEPIHDGYLLSAWQRSLSGPDPSVRSRAAEALGQMRERAGPAVPALAAALRDEDPGVRRAALWALGEMIGPAQPTFDEVGAGLRDADQGVRRQALLTLVNLSSYREGEATYFIKADESRVVPHLLAALADEDEGVRRDAAWAFGREISRVSAASFEAVRRHPDPRVRRRLAAILFGEGLEPRTGPGRSAAPIEEVPVLVECLRDPDAEVRLIAADALGLIGEPAVRALADELPSLEGASLHAALAALAAMRTAGKMAAGPVTSFLDHDDPAVRRAALGALLQLDPATTVSFRPLARLLWEGNEEDRVMAAGALTRFGPDAVGPLTNALLDPSPPVVRAAVESLRQLGPEAAPALPAFRGLLKRPEAPHEVILDVTSRCRGQGVKALGDWLTDAPRAIRAAVARTLGGLGPAARGAVPALAACLGDDDLSLCDAAAQALARIGPESRPALQAALKGGNSQVRHTVVVALGRVGRPAAWAVPLLRDSLRDDNEAVRTSAAETLRNIEAAPVEQPIGPKPVPKRPGPPKTLMPVP